MTSASLRLMPLPCQFGVRGHAHRLQSSRAGAADAGVEIPVVEDHMQRKRPSARRRRPRRRVGEIGRVEKRRQVFGEWHSENSD